jgi:hypothetical protein
MDSKTGPRLRATSLEEGSAFPRAAGLILDEITPVRVTGPSPTGLTYRGTLRAEGPYVYPGRADESRGR